MGIFHQWLSLLSAWYIGILDRPHATVDGNGSQWYHRECDGQKALSARTLKYCTWITIVPPLAMLHPVACDPKHPLLPVIRLLFCATGFTSWYSLLSITLLGTRTVSLGSLPLKLDVFPFVLGIRDCDLVDEHGCTCYCYCTGCSILLMALASFIIWSCCGLALVLWRLMAVIEWLLQIFLLGPRSDGGVVLVLWRCSLGLLVSVSLACQACDIAASLKVIRCFFGFFAYCACGSYC